MTKSEKAEPFRDSTDVAAILWIGNNPHQWIESVKSLCRLPQVSRLFVGMFENIPEAGKLFADKKIEIVQTVSLPGLIQQVMDLKYNQIFLVSFPVVVPPDVLDTASEWVARDARVATVSFLSNSAGYLSFPYRNTEHPVGAPGYNEVTLTRRLREIKPLPGPVPIQIPEGSAVLLGASALTTAGLPDENFDRNPKVMLAEFALRASRRGFISLLDSTTYITTPWDGSDYHKTPIDQQNVREKLYAKHSFFPGLYDHEKNEDNAPLAVALDLSRAKAEGLRILIDGWCLGPQEMGTQAVVMALVLSLAEHDLVKWVAVGVPDPAKLPAYAQKLFHTPKIQVVPIADLTFPDAPSADILHRPYQPSGTIPFQRWRDIAKRNMITIHDLIAYRNGSYFFSWIDWRTYRESLKLACACTDSVTSISKDTVNSILEERLEISTDALYVVENGINHRDSNQTTRVPDLVAERGLTTTPFLFVLGATYSHKNRDLALRVWQGLRARGHNLALIMAGATVPRGSTRLEEAMVSDFAYDENYLVLPDVSSEERNWLLKHTCLVMYPTSAEGFGLVPFEAASFNRPTLHVAFGPLKELIDDEEIPKTWDLGGLIDRAEALITDQTAAARSIKSALQKSDSLSWDKAAQKYVEAYFDTLSRIPHRRS